MKTCPVPFATLLAGLANPHGQMRRKTITAIMRRRNERAQAFASLLALLNDPEDQVRKIAIKALGRLDDPRAIPALQSLLTHQSARFRLLVLRALVQVDHRQALPHLLTALHDRSVPIRREAVSKLGTLIPCVLATSHIRSKNRKETVKQETFMPPISYFKATKKNQFSYH